MLPVILTIPSRRPIKGRSDFSAGTSFATGFPRLVITTGSRVLLTSSMTARQRALNSPAGIVFGELMEGVAAMNGHREGKLTLRSYKIDPAPLPKVDSKLIRDTRKRLHCSRAVFARKLRINERTLEKWEQGRAKPNPQAAALVLLVRKYPDTLERLERVAVG